MLVYTIILRRPRFTLYVSIYLVGAKHFPRFFTNNEMITYILYIYFINYDFYKYMPFLSTQFLKCVSINFGNHKQSSKSSINSLLNNISASRPRLFTQAGIHYKLNTQFFFRMNLSCAEPVEIRDLGLSIPLYDHTKRYMGLYNSI